MARYFVSNGTIVAAPHDTNNDGLDAIGFGITGMAYDDLGHGDGSYRLYDSGSGFASYTWQSGDQIYISGASVNNGLYTIASKVSSDVILLTTSATGGGDDSDVDSATGPFATVQHGVDTAIAGDDLVICGASNYTPAAQIDFDTNVTTRISYVRIMGATARGVVDGTRATLDFTSATGNDGFSMTGTADVDACYVAHLNILNAPRHGVFLDTTCYWAFENCRVSGCVSSGLRSDAGNAAIAAYGCEMDDNAVGVECSSGSRGPLLLIGCSVHDNTDSGVKYASAGSVFFNTQFFNNGASGAERITGLDDYARTNAVFANCTFFENGDAGIELGDAVTGRTIVMSSVFRTNTNYAIDTASEPAQIMINSDCCFSNNGAVSDEALPAGNGNITVDPEFESETNGSEDLEPDSTSPLIGAGFSWSFSEGNSPQHVDIGAVQREMAEGGGDGGLLTHPGMSGGMRG